MSAQALPKITPEQYLEAERVAEFKSEYYGGQSYAMAGCTIPHAHIIANFTGALFQALRGGTCFVLSSAARLRVSASGLYTYPDLMVVCGDPKYADDRRDTVLNPTLIVEVLSESTASYDRGGKFAHYRKIVSLVDYLLISQHEPRIERYVRQPEGPWARSEVRGLEATLDLPSIQCSVPMAEIYDRVLGPPPELI